MNSNDLGSVSFAHLIDVSTLKRNERVETLTTSHDERSALAELLGIDELTKLSATVILEPHSTGRGWRVRSAVKAVVIQPCVVSLEPVKTSIDSEMFRDFVWAVDAAKKDKEEEVDPEGGDLDRPDVLTDGNLDIGEVVVEHLALEIPLFPRKDGATVDLGRVSGIEIRTDDDVEVVPESPFAVLKELKEKLK